MTQSIDPSDDGWCSKLMSPKSKSSKFDVVGGLDAMGLFSGRLWLRGEMSSFASYDAREAFPV